MPNWTELVEPGRAIMASPRLSRVEKVTQGPQDEKFAFGDLVVDVPDEQLDDLAAAIGGNLTGSSLRSYREVARAWPAERRVAASWTAHRTLKNVPGRFEIIKPGMTLREAQEAIGKNPADTEHPSRWSLERRVPFIINQLQDDATTKSVREQLEGRKKVRAVRAATKMVEEDRSAEYRDALRQFREARDAKHPERAAYDALFKIREAREYVRAVGKESSEDDSFIPAHLRPDLIVAVRDLAITGLDVIAVLAGREPSASEALLTLMKHIEELHPQQVSTTFDGVVISGEVGDSPARPATPAVVSRASSRSPH